MTYIEDSQVNGFTGFEQTQLWHLIHFDPLCFAFVLCLAVFTYGIPTDVSQ